MDKFIGAITTIGVAFISGGIVYQLVKKSGSGASEISTVGSTVSDLGGDLYKT
jgi:hypothetical protein